VVQNKLHGNQNHKTERDYPNPVVTDIHATSVPSTSQIFLKELTQKKQNIF
jgi:hypothetical protein